MWVHIDGSKANILKNAVDEVRLGQFNFPICMSLDFHSKEVPNVTFKCQIKASLWSGAFNAWSM